MNWTFKFLLTNGTTERHSFRAIHFKDAQAAAIAWSRAAFRAGELYDFDWEA